jgi:hypothetical protein
VTITTGQIDEINRTLAQLRAKREMLDKLVNSDGEAFVGTTNSKEKIGITTPVAEKIICKTIDAITARLAELDVKADDDEEGAPDA